MNITLSTLAVGLGVIFAVPQVYGLARPAGLAAIVRLFPRHLPAGVFFMLLGTAWFLYNLNQETIAEVAAFRPHLLTAFAALGLLCCVFVRDFLAVRGLAIVLLCLAKLMVDTGRPHLGDTAWVLVFQAWAYVFVIAGIWLTISPWRLRDWLAWATATPQRTRFTCGVRLAFCLLIIALGLTAFRGLR